MTFVLPILSTPTYSLYPINADLTAKLDKTWKSGWGNSANEHYIVVNAGAGGTLLCYIPSIVLSSTAIIVQLGSGSTTTGVAVVLSVTNVSCVCTSCYVNGTSVTPTLTYYYR